MHKNRSRHVASCLTWACTISLLLGSCGGGNESGPPERDDPAPAEPAAHGSENAVASRDGVIVFFDDRGSGDKSIVFVHGWNCDRDYWQLQRDYYAENFRVVSVDLAGHGQSALNRQQWSIGAFGDDVAAVVRKLNLTDVTLVGHSMGGMVVLEAAQKLGDRVRQVVGVDTLRSPDQIATDEQVAAFIAALEADYTTTVTDFVKTMFVESSHARVRDFVVRDMASGPPEVAIGSLLAMAEYDTLAALDALDKPLSLINSDYEKTNTALLNEHVDKFRLQEVTGVGHFIMLEDPVTFTTYLNSILE